MLRVSALTTLLGTLPLHLDDRQLFHSFLGQKPRLTLSSTIAHPLSNQSAAWKGTENTLLPLQSLDPNYKYVHTMFREKANFRDSSPRLNTRITWGVRCLPPSDPFTLGYEQRVKSQLPPAGCGVTCQ